MEFNGVGSNHCSGLLVLGSQKGQTHLILFSNRLEYFNSKYLQKILLREYDQPKSSIVLLYEKLERKHAMELAQAGQLGHSPAQPSFL